MDPAPAYIKMQMFNLMVHGMHSSSSELSDWGPAKIFALARTFMGSHWHLFMCQALAVLLCGFWWSELTFLLLRHQRDKSHRHEICFGN